MNAAGEAAPFLFIIAGEPSGDALGGALIAALRERTSGRLRIAGIGGEAMAAQGLASLVPLADLAVAGLAEVLPRAPLILRRVRETVAAIRALKPDAVITIDSSGFGGDAAEPALGREEHGLRADRRAVGAPFLPRLLGLDEHPARAVAA